MKKCNKCGIEKPLTEYSKNSKSKDKYNYFCKPCTSSYNYKYHKTGRKRKDNIKFKYGMSLPELESMYELQEGKCVICHTFKPTFNKTGGLYIDHDHASKHVRGLLCNSCNVMLGLAKDSILLLESAIAYLKVHKKEG